MPDSIWQVASSKAGRGREVHKKQNHEVIIVKSRGLELPACNTGSSLSPEEHTRAEELLLKWVSCLCCPLVKCCCVVAKACTYWASPGASNGRLGLVFLERVFGFAKEVVVVS